MNATTLRTATVAVCLSLTTCATRPEQRTIEPGGTASEPGGDDLGFVLSRERKVPASVESVQINPSEKWWKFRGSFLKLSEAQAKERDNNVSEVRPPEKFWDEQTAGEAASLWIAVCTECHGGRRRLEDAVGMPVPAARWGQGEGLFFGTRRRYTDVFFTIFRGGPERNGVPSEMPPWRGKISKEMVWALLYFLEYQSGGIEGRFPPSLRPRQDATEIK